MLQNFCCPHCGNKDLLVATETSTTTEGKNYSGGQGCLGFLLFGPLGLLCGKCGQSAQTTTTNVTYFVCSNCGKRFQHPDELRRKIKNLQPLPMLPSAIIVVGLCLLFYLLFYFTLGIAFALFFSALGGLVAYFTIRTTNRNNDIALSKLENELRELEYNMNRFKDE